MARAWNRPSVRDIALLAALLGCAAVGACERRVDIAGASEPRVRHTDVERGVGPEATEGRMVEVHYEGRLPSGEVFLSTYEDGKPHTWELGNGTVIVGMDRAVVGMRPGGVRTVKIPPELHWGRKGYGGVVPENATLTFEITLVSVN